MNPVRTILFDLDGTIVDTEPTAAQAIVTCFVQWGAQLEEVDAHFINGRKWDVAFDHLFQKYKLPLSKNEASQVILKEYRRCIEAHLKIVPGSVEAVKALSQQFQVGLVSGSQRADILWSLGKLQILDQFQMILGAEDYLASKPAPDGYLRAMALMGADPATTLVFEDSHAGIASARAAQTWVVAVEAANHLNLDQSRAHLKIRDFTSVTSDWVKSLSLS